jgi:hypothetical protein
MVMAKIYVQCGMYDEALSEIEYILSLESRLTINDFKMNKVFDPLKDNPEFQALMNKYALAPGA